MPSCKSKVIKVIVSGSKLSNILFSFQYAQDPSNLMEENNIVDSSPPSITNITLHSRPGILLNITRNKMENTE